MDLSGVVDLHLHTGPDVRSRSIDDLSAARAALAQRMGGVLFKNHHTPTAARAGVARLAVPGAPVYGGVVLNAYVGGLNPAAVESAALLGGRAVWLPTFSARNHRKYEGLGDDGVDLLDAEGSPAAALMAVLERVAAHDLLLCTGHVSASEVLAVVPAARHAGVNRILIQHAEHPVSALTHDQQRQLADQGAFLERCYAHPKLGGGHAPAFDQNVAAIRAVGAASTVLSSDLGQPDNPSWPEGYAAYLDQFLAAGISHAQMDLMCRRNPATLLGVPTA